MPEPATIEKTTRMSAADRRELILAAASKAFARGGFAGTSTDTIARASGVSQPYVVRLFGTKVELFCEVLARATDAIIATFATELDRLTVDPEADEFWRDLGAAYGTLLSDRDLLHVLVHGFAAGADPAIGAQARSGLAAIYRMLRERTGCTPDRAREFLARGMLLNTLLVMGAPEHAGDHPDLDELVRSTFGTMVLDGAAAIPAV